MRHEPLAETDDRLNELSDRDALWGPLIGFRPEKNQCFSVLRALALAGAVGGIYGALLNFGLLMLCRLTKLPAPSFYGVPLLLTSTYFVAFQATLGPAWNRRARLLVRRAEYLRSIGQMHEEL
jgi:hypothetical protein